MNDKTLGGTDYDVWAETDKLLSDPNIIIRYQHVMGHQADTLQEQCGMRGPLQREAHYNEVCDTIAGNTRMSHAQPFHTSMFPASKIEVFTGETYVTANVYDRIRDHLTGSDMAQYIRSSNDMDDRVFDTINWEAIGRYMKRMPISKQVKHSKYMHNWQNTGRQKQKFAISAGLDTTSEEHRNEHECTFGCEQVEKHQHYLRCKKSPKCNHRMECLKSIREWMVRTKDNEANANSDLYEHDGVDRGW